MSIVKYVYILEDPLESDEKSIEYQLSGSEILDYILSQDFGLVSKFYKEYRVDQYVLEGRVETISRCKNTERYQELSSTLHTRIHIPYGDDWLYSVEQHGNLISIVFSKERVLCLT